MQIEFEFSGGYGGVFARQPLAVRVDTDDLPEDKGSELMALVQSSGILELERLKEPSGSERDVFAYHLSIRHGDVNRSFTFDDATVPASVHPLLAFLRQLAIEMHNKQS